jgi:hypothetical protein
MRNPSRVTAGHNTICALHVLFGAPAGEGRAVRLAPLFPLRRPAILYREKSLVNTV